jgi:hypothetical protein
LLRVYACRTSRGNRRPRRSCGSALESRPVRARSGKTTSRSARAEDSPSPSGSPG